MALFRRLRGIGASIFSRPVQNDHFFSRGACDVIHIGNFFWRRHQPDRLDAGVAGVNVNVVEFGIVRSAWPVRASGSGAHRECAERTFQFADGRRSVNRTEVVVRGDFFPSFAKSWREIDQIIDGNAVAAIGWRFCGNGLRVGIPLAGDAADFDRFFGNGPDGLASDAIENIKKALLGWLSDGLDRFSVNGDVRKNGRGGNVHVPEWVVDQLEVPLALAGFQVDADQGFTEQIISGAMAAIKIAGGRLDWQVDQSELLVHGNLRPHAGVAGVFRGTFLPGVVAKLAFLRDGMENPEALAGSNVESAHVAFIVAHALGRHAFAESGADNDRIFRHDGRRLNADFAGN